MSFNINKFVKDSNDYSDHKLDKSATIVVETIDETKTKKSKNR